MKTWVCLLTMVLLATAASAVQDEQAQEPEYVVPQYTAAELVTQADEKLAAGDEDGAVEKLQTAMRAEGVTGEMALRLGMLRVSRGELDLAIDAYGIAADLLEGAAKGEVLGRMAVLQDTRGMTEAAAASAEAAVAADPEGLWPTIAISYRRVKEGRVDEAVELAQRAVDAGGGATAQGALGYALQAKGDTPGAEAAYRAAMAADETNVAPAIGLARLLRTSGRAAEAEPLLNQVLEISPGAVEAYKEMARVKIALGRAQEALGDASIAAAMAENDPEAQALAVEVRVARAVQDMREGNAALAEQDLTQLRDEHPDSPEVRLGLARAQLERRDADAAIVELTKAVELNPDYAEAQYELGRVQLQMKAAPAAAVPPLEKAVGLDAGNPTYMTTLGVALLGAQQFDRVVEVLTQATALPEYANAEGFLSLGQAYVNLKDYGAAVPVLKKAGELAPDAAPVWATLGWAYFGLKDAENFKMAAGKARGLGYNETTLLDYLKRIEAGEPIQ
jgi:tetratricopeptide (TPR) repeat protein